MTPQIIILVLFGGGIFYTLAKHGEDKKPEKYNVWWSIFSAAIIIGLLTWGGFFKCFGW